MSTGNTFPKLHNAAWPGLVGKEEGTDNPPIPFEQMLEWTANAEVNGNRFDGIDLFLSLPHTDIDSTKDDLQKLADQVGSQGPGRSVRWSRRCGRQRVVVRRWETSQGARRRS